MFECLLQSAPRAAHRQSHRLPRRPSARARPWRAAQRRSRAQIVAIPPPVPREVKPSCLCGSSSEAPIRKTSPTGLRSCTACIRLHAVARSRFLTRSPRHCAHVQCSTCAQCHAFVNIAVRADPTRYRLRDRKPTRLRVCIARLRWLLLLYAPYVEGRHGEPVYGYSAYGSQKPRVGDFQ